MEDWHQYDCFNETEQDPALSRAIESSLWETEALGNHWCHQVWPVMFCWMSDIDASQVSAHAQILLKDLTNRARSSEKKIGFAISSSYSSMIRENLQSTNSHGKPATANTLFEQSERF